MLRSEAAMSGRRSSNCEGTPTGTGGAAFKRFDGHRKIRWGGADQDRNGVFILRARNSEIVGAD